MRRLVVVCILVAAACGRGAGQDHTTISLDEFTVASSSGVLSAGEVQLSIVNEGEFPHTLLVTTTSGDVVAATELIMPGTETELTVRLEAGTHLFTCRIVAQDGAGSLIDHFERGMVTRLPVAS